jgi:hypothetical protein
VKAILAAMASGAATTTARADTVVEPVVIRTAPPVVSTACTG